MWRTWCGRVIELDRNWEHTHNPSDKSPVYYNKNHKVLITAARSQATCFQCVSAVTKHFMDRDT